jgi:hypothetical protein
MEETKNMKMLVEKAYKLGHEKAGGHSTVCPGVAGKAASWMVELIMAENLLPR